MVHIDVFKSWPGTIHQAIEAFSAPLEPRGPADAVLHLTSYRTHELS